MKCRKNWEQRWFRVICSEQCSCSKGNPLKTLIHLPLLSIKCFLYIYTLNTVENTAVPEDQVLFTRVLSPWAREPPSFLSLLESQAQTPSTPLGPDWQVHERKGHFGGVKAAAWINPLEFNGQSTGALPLHYSECGTQPSPISTLPVLGLTS